MKPLGQCILGSAHEILFLFLVEELFHLRLGGMGSLFFFCCVSGNETRVDCLILGL